MLTLEKARKALAAVEAEAKKMGLAVSACAVDGTGTPVATIRMDGAMMVSPKFAFNKAFTAALLGMPTGDIAPYAVPGKPYFGINSVDKRFIVMAGGLPIKEGNQVVGGLGVGGSYDTAQDVTCAQAGLKAIG